jgi:hypothetical protein
MKAPRFSRQDAMLILCFLAFTAATLFVMHAHAVSLEVYGHSVGQGVQNLSFAGEALNVSILQNGSAWNLSIGGQA